MLLGISNNTNKKQLPLQCRYNRGAYKILQSINVNNNRFYVQQHKFITILKLPKKTDLDCFIKFLKSIFFYSYLFCKVIVFCFVLFCFLSVPFSQTFGVNREKIVKDTGRHIL